MQTPKYQDKLVDVRHLHADAPVDRTHVETLKASIQQRGQLAPLLVWAKGNEVIDGFHRLHALSEIGVNRAHVKVIECSEEEFRDARIISAATHKGVSFARVTLWVREEFLRTKWASHLNASEAFRVGGKRGEYLSMQAFEKHWGRGLSGGELYEIVAWVKEKSAVWGLSPDQIANMLEIAERASPLLVPLVRPRKHRREEVLTRPTLAKIVQHIPDHTVQEAVARKVMTEKLDEREAVRLVGEVAGKGREEVAPLLATNWLELEAARKQERVATSRALTPEELQKRAEQMHATMTIALINDLADRIRVMPKPVPASLANDLGSALTRLYEAIAEYTGYKPDIADHLLQEVARLNTENGKLEFERTSAQKQLESLRKKVGLGQQMYVEDTHGRAAG